MIAIQAVPLCLRLMTAIETGLNKLYIVMIDKRIKTMKHMNIVQRFYSYMCIR
jgi:hypothetical protein